MLSTILLGIVTMVIHLRPSTQQQPFQLVFERSVGSDSIALKCRNVSNFLDIDVERNLNIRFYLNFTEGDRNGPADMDERISPQVLRRNGVQATFLITPQLNGFYSCGTGPGQQSDVQPLICKQFDTNYKPLIIVGIFCGGRF